MAQTEDGGFAFTGMATSVGDAYVVRLDSNGTQIWNYWYSDAPELRAYAIITRPSGCAVVGTRQFNYDNNMFLLLINESGGIQALNSFGGTEDDVANCVISTADGGLLLAGGTSSFGAQGSDMYVVKTDGAGNFQWQRSYGRSWSDGVFAVDRTQDGGYIFAGYTTNIHPIFGFCARIHLVIPFGRRVSAGRVMKRRTQ
ncbi:MAG: hypothetical protein IPP40_11405 [bacterium]|nr:hypothetical protein [bacterium]